MQVERYNSVGEIPALEWDRLACDSPLGSHRWLHVYERASLPARRRLYVTASNGDGLAAAVAAEIHEPGPSQRSLDSAVYGRVQPLAERLLLGVAPAIVGNACLAARDLPRAEVRAATAAVLAGLERAADEEGWSVGFRRVTRNGTGYADLLSERGYLRLLEAPVTRLSVDPEWRSFADYRRFLRREHPKTAGNMSREINKGVKGGLRFERLRGEAAALAVWPELLDRHFKALNGAPFPYRSALTPLLDETFREDALLLAGWVGDRPAGVSIGFRSGTAAAMTFIGVDHEVGREASALFNLSYNQPIEYWIGKDVREVHYGTMLYETKLRRGLRIVPAYLYLRGRGPAHRAALAALSRVQTLRMQQRFRFALDHAESGS